VQLEDGARELLGAVSRDGLAVSNCLEQVEGLLSDQLVISALGGGERNKLI